MSNISIENLIIISLFLFVYNYSLFALVRNIFNKKDFGALPISFLSVCNTVIFFVFIEYSSDILLLYITLFCLFSLEFFWIRKGKPFDVLFVVNAVMVNIMTVQSVTLCIYGWYGELSFYEIIHTPRYYVYSLPICLAVLTLLTSLVNKGFAHKELAKILRNKLQRTFLFIWFVVINIYFIYNAQIYSTQIPYNFSIINQFLASLSFLFSFFYMLIYTLKNCHVIELTEKNIYYKAELINQQKIMHNFIQNAHFQLDLNLTQGKIMSGHGYREHLLINNDYNYTRTFGDIATQLVKPEHKKYFLDMLSIDTLLEKFDQGINVQSFEFQQKNHESEESYYWFRCTLSMIKDGLSGDIKAIAYVENIDEEKKRHSELSQRAQIDSLSGLNNREHTKKLIEQHLKNGPGVLFLIDVDNFKEINDSMGHSMGDEVLRSLSTKLRQIFRGDDVIGRIGGDEFMAYVPSSLQRTTIIRKVEQVIKAFHNTYTDMDGKDHVISSSVGIFIVADAKCEFEDAYHKADIAMYQTKNNGKNGYTIYVGGTFSGYESNRV